MDLPQSCFYEVVGKIVIKLLNCNPTELWTLWCVDLQPLNPLKLRVKSSYLEHTNIKRRETFRMTQCPLKTSAGLSTTHKNLKEKNINRWKCGYSSFKEILTTDDWYILSRKVNEAPFYWKLKETKKHNKTLVWSNQWLIIWRKFYLKHKTLKSWNCSVKTIPNAHAFIFMST